MEKAAPRYHRELIVWQRAMDLVMACYQISERMPRKETYGLASQLRRAAVSIPLNIAEGNGRSTRGEYLNALSIAHGSLMEVETLCDITDRMAYTSTGELTAARVLSAHVGRLLHGLIRSLRRTTWATDSTRRRSSPVPRPSSPADPQSIVSNSES